MRIYLMRHGEAVSTSVDSSSPLSAQGERDIFSIGRVLADAQIHLSTIFHSSKLRAKKTAEIIASALHFQGDIKMISGLEPNDDVRLLTYEINSLNADALYVGHMPFMGMLVSQLLNDKPDLDPVFFKTGTIVCLEKIYSSNWIINWVINPELFANNFVAGVN